MKFVLVLLACLVGVAQSSVAQAPTSDEFRRLRSFAVTKGFAASIPGNLARRLGWSTGTDVPSHRLTVDEERIKDRKVLKRYGVDVQFVSGRERMLLLSQQVPGDTTILWLFDDSGRILRVFEYFENRDWHLEEVFGGAYDSLGRASWRHLLALKEMP